jgi:hypothetical protein
LGVPGAWDPPLGDSNKWMVPTVGAEEVFGGSQVHTMASTLSLAVLK